MFNPESTTVTNTNAVNPVSLTSTTHQPKTILRKVVDQVVNSFSPAAARNNSPIINDIPEKILAEINESALTQIIKGLLYAVVNNAKDSSIRVSARMMYGRMVEIFVKDHNSYHTYAIACCLQDVVPLAEKIGGDINIINQKEKITTVSFTFPAATASC